VILVNKAYKALKDKKVPLVLKGRRVNAGKPVLKETLVWRVNKVILEHRVSVVSLVCRAYRVYRVKLDQEGLLVLRESKVKLANRV
jgi:hypothetical protein